MEIKLIPVNSKTAGQEVVVTGPRFFIGRAEDCHLRPRSDLVSRHHCVILIEEGFVAVRDFGSKNGTFVNNQKVGAETPLNNGDRLRIGTLEFEVRIGSTVELKAKKKPKVRSVQEVASRTVESAAPKDDADVSSWLDDDETGPLGETTTMDPTRTLDAPAAKSSEPARPAKEKEKEKAKAKGKPKPKPEPEEEEEEPQVEDEAEEDDFDLGADEEEEEEVKPGKGKTSSSAFKSSGGPSGPSTSNSKDAAANMLKNFFRR